MTALARTVALSQHTTDYKDPPPGDDQGVLMLCLHHTENKSYNGCQMIVR